jgi:broad specificity phosphatase PhoE
MALVYLLRHGEADYQPIRKRCTTALTGAISELPGHEVVIVVAHLMVIWSLTGNRETRPGQWRTIDVPDGTCRGDR